MVVDSGACDSVMPTEMLGHIPANTNTPQFGQAYTVANGAPIENEGEKKFSAYTEDGYVKNFNMQVAKVDKPLLSVSGMVSKGNCVIFHPHGSYIQNLYSGEVTWIKENNGMYILPVSVPAPF